MVQLATPVQVIGYSIPLTLRVFASTGAVPLNVTRLLETVITALPLTVKVPGSSAASADKMPGAACARKSLIGCGELIAVRLLAWKDRYLSSRKAVSCGLTIGPFASFLRARQYMR